MRKIDIISSCTELCLVFGTAELGIMSFASGKNKLLWGHVPCTLHLDFTWYGRGAVRFADCTGWYLKDGCMCSGTDLARGVTQLQSLGITWVGGFHVVFSGWREQFVFLSKER